MRSLLEDWTTDKAWTLLAAGTAAAAAAAVRIGLRGSWRLVRREDPPLSLESTGARWQEALVWAGVSGLAAGCVRVLAREGAARAWYRATGRRPPAA